MQTYTLNNGLPIPAIGLGTWKSPKEKVGEAVLYAIEHVGYRHIDCASIYGNEKEIGNALLQANKSIKREELFITSKLWNTDHNPENVEDACRQTLADLQLEYLDLYLMHWGIAFAHGDNTEPVDTDGKAITASISIRETWEAMEQLVKKGLVKSIGVANFTTMMLLDLLTYASIKPAMNQIELHPYNTQTELVEFCLDRQILITAYSPLGRADEALHHEPIIVSLAKKYQKTPPQILLNFAISRGTIPIPKSTNKERITENFAVFDFALTKQEQSDIATLNKNYRLVNPIGWWGIPYFS